MGQAGVGGDQRLGVAAGFVHDGRVAQQVGDPQRRQAVLPRAEQLARPAQREVDLGQPEAVGRSTKAFEPLVRLLGLRRRRTRSRSPGSCRG